MKEYLVFRKIFLLLINALFFTFLFINVSIASDTYQHLVNRSISPGTSEIWSQSVSIPEYGVLTGVQVQIENYTAYADYENSVSLTLQKDSINRIVIYTGTLPDSKTVLPSGDPGTYTTSMLNYWNGSPVGGTYQLNLNVASDGLGAPFFDRVNLILTYNIVYPDIVLEKNYMVSTTNASQELATPKVGDEVYFNADFRVDDADLKRPFFIRCFLGNDPSPFHSQEYSALDQGSRIYYSTSSLGNSWVVTPGTHTVRWEIDANNDIPESNENNNGSSRTWVVEDLFDLVAKATTLVKSDGSPTNAHIGETVYLKFDFDVNGVGTSPSFDVRCLVDDEEIWATNNITRTGGGSYSLQTSNGWVVTSGQHNVSCELDYNHDIAETREDNNIATTGFTSEYAVTPSVSVFPASAPQGTTFSEPGTGFTPNSTATLHFSGPSGPSSVPDIATDENGAFSHSWTCDACPVGEYSYYAVDDVTGQQSNIFTFTVYAAPPTLTPLYRLYKSNYPDKDFKDHLYTINWAERVSAERDFDYTFERIEGYISKTPFPGSTPLYRLRNTTDNSHYYTTDSSDKETFLGNGYILDGGGVTGIVGTEGYVSQTYVEGMVPLYRLHQTKDASSHYFLCIRQSEYQNTLDQDVWGFQDQGIIAYISPDGIRDPLAHRRPQANFGGVDLGTGAYRGLNNLDLLMKGRGPDLAFSHYYNSFNSDNNPMGMGWSHSLASEITEVVLPFSEADEHNQDIYVHWGNGTGSYFKSTGSGMSDYADKTGNHDLLTKIDDGYNLTKKDQTVYEFRRFNITPPAEFTTFCNEHPSSILCNFSKIVPTKIKDWAGNFLTFEYYSDNANLKAVSDTMNRRLELEYDASGKQLIKVTEMVNEFPKRFVSFTYNALGLLETFTDAEGKITRYAYYDNPTTVRHHLLQSITYPEHNTVVIDYDLATGKVKSVNDGGQTDISYNVFIPEYQEDGWNTVTDPTGKIFDIFNVNGMLHKMRGRNDPEGDCTLIERTDTTNNPNLPTRVVDVNDNATSFAYDPRGNLLKITNARNWEANYTYDEVTNRIESATVFHDPSSQNPPPPTTEYAYYLSNPNLLKTIARPETGVVELFYNANNQVERVVDGRNHSTYYTYDDLYGNLEEVKEVIDAEDHITSYVNDYAGRTISVTDAEDIKTTFAYDYNDNPEAISNYARGGQSIIRAVSRAYDDNDNLDDVSWNNSGTDSLTDYSYDGRDRLQSVTTPAGFTKLFTYYDNDLPHTIKDCNNITATLVYDDRNRLQQKNFTDSSQNVDYEYFTNGKLKQVYKGNNSSLKTAFTYNNLNLVESVIDRYGKEVSYGYDNAGHLTSITYPGGFSVAYTYDGSERLETVSADGTLLATYFYDAAGNLERIERENNIDTIYSFDQASRLTGITERNASAITLWSYAYTLDEVGNHLSVDTVNEPLEFSGQSENISYNNDKANNRLISAGDTGYTYDNNGNRITSATAGVTTTYDWDYENRLTAVAIPDQPSLLHTYDALGNRVARQADGVTTHYVLDLNSSMSRVLMETDTAGNPKAYYVYGHGLVARVAADGVTRRFYHYNHRGDTIALTDDSGQITDRYAYGEYGRVQADAGNTTDNPFTYVGRFGVMNEGHDLYFMRARFYDAHAGRFLSEDPLGFGGGDWNLFAYVGGNPLMGIDPKGLSELEDDSPILEGLKVPVYKLAGAAGTTLSFSEGYMTITEAQFKVYQGAKEDIESLAGMVAEGYMAFDVAIDQLIEGQDMSVVGIFHKILGTDLKVSQLKVLLSERILMKIKR